MAVSPDESTGAGGADPVGGAPDLPITVDTTFSPIYRFLRVLVHLVNRAVFRTTVSPVDRESADREALRRAERVLLAGEALILFPEGERRAGPVVQDLHEGVAFLAARTGATVVPVGIGGSASVMPKGAKVPRPRHIHLEVGEPLPAPERSGSGRIPRSRMHVLTESLTSSLQDLYDRSVEVTGRY